MSKHDGFLSIVVPRVGSDRVVVARLGTQLGTIFGIGLGTRSGTRLEAKLGRVCSSSSRPQYELLRTHVVDTPCIAAIDHSIVAEQTFYVLP
jgi:hypothetical protein